jgi:hypothetical protein
LRGATGVFIGVVFVFSALTHPRIQSAAAGSEP